MRKLYERQREHDPFLKPHSMTLVKPCSTSGHSRDTCHYQSINSGGAWNVTVYVFRSILFAKTALNIFLSSTQVHVRACCQMGSVPIILINSEKVSIMTFETQEFMWLTHLFLIIDNCKLFKEIIKLAHYYRLLVDTFSNYFKWLNE